MIIHSPIFSGSITQDSNHAYANLSGSFSGSFTGIGNFTGLEADSVEFDNVLNKPALVSGSQQVIDLLPTGVVSGSTQLTTEFDARYLNTSGDGIVSGSQQVKDLLPAGTVSGSSQVDVLSTTNIARLATTGSNIFNGDQSITGSINVKDSAGTFAIVGNGFSEIYLQSNGGMLLQAGGGGVQIKSNSLAVDNNLTVEGYISGEIRANNGVVSGSSQINLASVTGNSTSNVTEGTNLYYTDARVKTKLTEEGVISGSSQVTLSSTTGFTTYSSSVDSRIVTEKGRVDAILAASDANYDTFAEIVTLINSVDTSNDTVFAGFVTSSNAANAVQDTRLTSIESATSSYETKGNGIVSGSSQISLGSVTGNSTSNVTEGTNLYYTDARVKTKLTAEGVISGSSQVTYASISSIPAGIVSGSSQISLGSVTGNSTSNVTEGTNLYYTDARVKTKLTAEAVISGSSQVSHNSTTGYVANEHIDHTGVSITAGNGLTGGGTIAATRTINVVGGNGITVNADNIELAGTYTGTWAVTGGITATADVVAYSASDRRLKDNIQNIENPIEKVQQLNGVTWDWNDNATELQKSIANVGVIAQEVEAVLPQLIQHRDTGYLAVDYAKLTGLLIEAIKEQQKQIDELKSKLK